MELARLLEIGGRSADKWFPNCLDRFSMFGFISWAKSRKKLAGQMYGWRYEKKALKAIGWFTSLHVLGITKYLKNNKVNNISQHFSNFQTWLSYKINLIILNWIWLLTPTLYSHWIILLKSTKQKCSYLMLFRRHYFCKWWRSYTFYSAITYF